MDLFEGGIVKFDDIRYMAKRLYGMLPTYCEPKQVVLDFSYSSPNVFSEITQLENPIFATSVMVSKKGKGSKVYVSASADNVENEKAFDVGNGDILSCGSLWRFIQVTGDKSGGDDVQLIVTGYELGYAFEPIPIEKEYIEGYAVQVDGAYPAVVSLRINDIVTNVQVNQDNGYFRWTGNIISLYNCLLDNKEVAKIKVRTKNNVSMYNFARRASNITEIDCRGITATDLYFAFGLNGPEYNRGERIKLHTLVLPLITSGTVNSQICCNNTTLLTNVDATTIENTLNVSNSPLTLQSAINILSALQDVTGYGGKTLTFSSTTSALVQADTMAMNLVAQAQANGWTITFN